MTSNFNSNRRTQEYSFKSKVFDDYPNTYINSINLDSDNGWLENSPVTPRISTTRRLDSQSVRSSNFNDNNTKSKDEFTIFGSFVRQRSERKSGISQSERTKATPRQSSNFKNLPVKSPQSQDFTSEYPKIIKTENINQLQSQLKYTPQTTLSPESLFDLIQSSDDVDNSFSPMNLKSANEFNSLVPVDQEPLVAQRRNKIESSFPSQSISLQLSPDESLRNKDDEISILQKNIGNKNKKIELLKGNNEKLQEHIKNLLNERKQLLHQIENTEFEEIIEEEEVQEAKPNYLVREVVKPVDVSHDNCIQRGKVTLEDLPARVLDHYRNEIIHQVREQKENDNRNVNDALKLQFQKKFSDLQAEYETLQKSSIPRGKISIEDLPPRMLESYKEQIYNQVKEQANIEKRSLMETHKMQQQKMLADLKAEYETVQKVSVQSYKKTRFNQIVSEANIQGTPKPQTISVGVNVLPISVSKQCQYETKSLNQFIAKTALTSQQKSILEKILNSVENNNYDGLLDTIGKSIIKSSTSIGINNTPVYNTRNTNTARVESVDTSIEFNAPIEVVKKAFVAQESRAVMVKPILLQRGCQPEDTFKFETGTMTDQIFCRSQGMNTVADYPDHRSPINLDPESVINRSTSRSESRKQTISQTTYMNSPTRDLINIHQERSLSPKISKPVQKIPETVSENIVEIKTFKVESKAKPINVIEEVKHIVEEKTHHVTSILDQNKVPKPEIPTTIECWETISHLKDGEVINKTETYHDQLVSTDVEKIKEHLDRFNLSHSTEVSPTSKSQSEVVMKFDEMVINSKLNENKSIPINLIPMSNDPRTNSKITETKIDRHHSSLPVDVKESTVKPNLGKRSAKETTYVESEKTIGSSGLKKSSNFKETKVNQNVSSSNSREQTLLSEITKDKEIKTLSEKTINQKPIEMKGIKSDKNVASSTVRKTTTEGSVIKGSSSNIKRPSDTMEIKIERKSSIPPKIELKSNSSVTKEPVNVKEINVQQNLSSPSTEKTIYEESEKTFSVISTKKTVEPKEIKVQDLSIQSNKKIIQESEPMVITQIKVQQNVSTPLPKETFYNEGEQSFSSSNIKKPVEIKEITVEHSITVPVVDKTNYRTSEQIFSSISTTKPDEVKKMKVQQSYSSPTRNETIFQQSEHTFSTSIVKEPIEERITLPENTIYHESEQTVTSSIARKPIKSLPKLKETTYHESESTIGYSNIKKPTTLLEVKVQPSTNQTTYNESEHSYHTRIVNDPKEIRGQRIFIIPSSTETTAFDSKQTLSYSDLDSQVEVKDIKVPLNYSTPIRRETTYEETEQTITYTTTTPSIPVTLESATNVVQSRIPHSIGGITSPKAFQSYSSTRAKSNFSTRKTENYSFESDERSKAAFPKTQSIPIHIKSSTSSTESASYNIPIIDFSSKESTNISSYSSNSGIISRSLASSNSAFHSLMSSTELKKTSPPSSNDNFTTDVSQILISENIFKCCTELLLWLKSINLVTTSTSDYLPSHLVSVSFTVVDWWVHLTTTLDASMLMATVHYLTTTFSKNLLKYLIINLDQQGNSCLHYIIGHQMWDSFNILESTKLVDPNIYNSQGYTVLMVACSSIVNNDNGRENLRRLALIANVNLTSKVQGQTAIFICALHNNSYMIQMLFTLGADINISDNEDNTPLMVACSKNHTDAVSTILSWSGVLIDLKNKEGKTAFDIAQDAGYEELLELFRQRKLAKPSEISIKSRVIQNSYNTSKSYGVQKY